MELWWAPIVYAFPFYFNVYKTAQYINLKYRDGNLKRIKLSRKWRWLFRLKGETVLLCSVIDQAIALVTIFMIMVGGYGLYFIVSPKIGAWFSVIMMMIGSCTYMINTISWGNRYDTYKKKTEVQLPGKRCLDCELEACVHDFPKRKVFVQSFLEGSDDLYQIQYGKWIKRTFYAQSYGEWIKRTFYNKSYESKSHKYYKPRQNLSRGLSAKVTNNLTYYI